VAVDAEQAGGGDEAEHGPLLWLVPRDGAGGRCGGRRRRPSRRCGEDRQRGATPGRADLGGVAGCCNAGRVGLNPFRQQRRSPADYLMVAMAVLVCVALVLWAFLG
jgi:hypothetical protein